MVEIRSEELQRAETKIREDDADLHISGEPGIGKSKFLENIQSRIGEDFCVIDQTIRHHHEPTDVARNILHEARAEASRRDNLPNKITGISGGFAGVSAGATTDQRATALHKLRELTEDWSGEQLIICIDDIHKLSDDNDIVRDVIEEILINLGEKVQLITVGQISLTRNDRMKTFHLNLFTPDETKQFIETKFGEVDKDTAKSVHDSLQGHPLYLDLLAESSDDEADLHLPEKEVFDTIQHRYLKTLPTETEEFLRKVAPLPELNERNVNSILNDYSSTQIDRQLRDLNQQVIVQEVNRTEKGRKIYKIHEVFREYLLQKEDNVENIHRTAFEFHANEILDIIIANDESAMEQSLPHSLNASYHLNQLYEEVDSEVLYRELERLETEYPRRGMLIAVCALFIVPLDALRLLKLEHENFSDWILDQTDQHPLARLAVQIVEWALSQFEEDSIDLSEVQIEGDLDNMPTESQAFAEVEISETHEERLTNSFWNLIAYFLKDEPFQSKSFRQQVENQIEVYGISVEILSKLDEKIKSELEDSKLGDELESALQKYIDDVDQELNTQLISELDFYELSELSMQFGYGTFDEVHKELLVKSGVLVSISLEGGKILEDAENPAFSLLWYSIWLTYFQDHPIEEAKLNKLTDRFEDMISQRKEFENEVEEPILTADTVSDNLELSDELS